MANTLLTNDLVRFAARDAAMILQSNLVAAALVNREVENPLITGNTGGQIRVKYVPSETANSQDHRFVAPSTLSVSNATENYVTLDARKYIYVRKDLNVLEATWQLEDFNRVVTMPAMVAIAEAVDDFMIQKIAGGFARWISGTPGQAPTVYADITAAHKVLQDNKCPKTGRVAIIGTEAEKNFLGDEKFINNDYGRGEVSGVALTDAMISRLAGVSWFVDQNAGTFSQGDIGGTVLSNGVTSGGETSFSIDGFTAATGVVNEGTRFTISGDTTTYIVSQDAAIAGNAATIEPTQAVVTGWADGAAVTFETPFTEDVIFHPGMVAGAIVAPAPLRNGMSAAATFGDVTVRVSFDSSFDGSSGAVDSVLFDVYCGCKVVRHQGGVILQEILS